MPPVLAGAWAIIAPMEPPPESVADLLQRARAARDAAALAEGSELAQRAWVRSAEAGSADERTEAGFLLCLFLYRLGALSELLDIGPDVLATMKAHGRRANRADLLRWMTLAGCEIGRFEA